MTRPALTLYGVTYRDSLGRVRHVRVLALTAAEAARHAQQSVVGFTTLERVILATRDPYRRPRLTPGGPS